VLLVLFVANPVRVRGFQNRSPTEHRVAHTSALGLRLVFSLSFSFSRNRIERRERESLRERERYAAVGWAGDIVNRTVEIEPPSRWGVGVDEAFDHAIAGLIARISGNIYRDYPLIDI
jgi:hypothetical protein